MFILFIKIILVVVAFAILGFVIAIFIAVRNERIGFKKMAKLHEENRKELDAQIDRILYDCEAE